MATHPARHPAARGTNPEQTERHLQQDKGAVSMLGFPSRRRPLQNVPELSLLSSDAGALRFVFFCCCGCDFLAGAAVGRRGQPVRSVLGMHLITACASRVGEGIVCWASNAEQNPFVLVAGAIRDAEGAKITLCLWPKQFRTQEEQGGRWRQHSGVTSPCSSFLQHC